MDISIDLQDDVALITMDDGKKNAIDLQALADLKVALDKAEADGGQDKQARSQLEVR